MNAIQRMVKRAAARRSPQPTRAWRWRWQPAWRLPGSLAIGVFCAIALVGWSARPARASTAYGDLNNFDVFNDTGQPCHGFEIELDDVRSTDITYTFDWNHYGAPAISQDNSDPAHPKVFVRYAAKYSAGAFVAFTAVPASAPSPTNGHMCTDPTVNIGCEHFGVGYYGTPSAVRYNWLIEDPLLPGTLIHGPAVNVATPNWTYYPPAPAQPVAQVQAVILAPPPPPAPVYEFGDAVWVKAIVTTSHNNAPLELKDLVSDDPNDPNDKNWRNGEPDEVEIEWQILQTEFNNPAGAMNSTSMRGRSIRKPTRRSATSIHRFRIPQTRPTRRNATRQPSPSSAIISVPRWPASMLNRSWV